MAPDLVALLLAEGRQVVVHRRTNSQVDDRADILTLDGHDPTGRNLAGAECRGQGFGGRVAAAEPAKVDHVPAAPACGLDEVLGHGLPRPRGLSRLDRDRRA